MIERRELIKRAGAVAVAGMAPMLPSRAQAKPGGHILASHYCKGTFDLKGIGTVSLNFGGTGYASFDNISDYESFSISQIKRLSTVAMRWEVNRCFANPNPIVGLVSATAMVRGRSSFDSRNAIMAAGPEGILPATMINQIHFLIEIPKLGIRMFNRDPMTLRGEVQPMTSERILADPRVKANPAGLATNMLKEVDSNFDPVGTHTLVQPVEFFDIDNPDEKRATLLSSTIESLPNYGVEVSLVRGDIAGEALHVEYEIRNLTQKTRQVVWYIDDSHDLRLVGGPRFERASLGREPIRVRAEARNTNARLKTAERSCMFCGVVSTRGGPDDFISGFNYSDRAHYKLLA
jgi:hypothetical protein